MENASKALIMAATVLLGLMIISVGVALFNSFSKFGKETIEKMESTKITEWNNNYLKYYGKIAVEENGKIKSVPIKVTAHDIISIINNARQNNVDYFGNNMADWPGKNENYYYVQIDIDKYKNGVGAEKWTEEMKHNFLKENTLSDDNTEMKYYKCNAYEISSVTKKVIYMQFADYDR